MYRYTDISSLEGRCVVHTVTGHSSLVAELTKALYAEVLVLGEHLVVKERGGDGVDEIRWRVRERV